MIDPATGWFEIFKIPTFDLEEVALDNDEYIDTSSARVSQMFNNTWRRQNVHFNMHKDWLHYHHINNRHVNLVQIVSKNEARYMKL